MTPGVLLRFWKYVEPEPVSGCWLWAGAVGGGYGQLRVDRKSVLAHRLSFEHHTGSIPLGHEIDHLCRVKLCVNPSHLDAVVGPVNQRRRWGMGDNGLSCRLGHSDWYWNPSGQRTCRTCHNTYKREQRRHAV